MPLTQAILARMGEKCDPHVYYTRVRLPMSGWRNNPALPRGLVYEGQFGGQVRWRISDV
jgi:indoleamine 2,3-dioxygenase